jgi:lipopolysaccharide biosynthesis glycosyltransferase
MHAAFALTSTGLDIYASICRIAIAALRESNPNIDITVACDSTSNKSLVSNRSALISEVDSWIVIDTPEGDPNYRSRYVKTILRQKIEGPFLYLDCDVLIRGDISDIFKLKADLALAVNHSLDTFEQQMYHGDQDTIIAMGWAVNADVYFNSGVIFYNDTPNAHLLSQHWHQNWLSAYKSTKKYQDQPSLNVAIYNSEIDLVTLPSKYNAQFKLNPKSIKDALIWHYYTAYFYKPHTYFELLCEELANSNSKKISHRKIKKLIRSNHPWRNTTKIDDFMASRIQQRGTFDGWEESWLKRNYKAFAVRLVKSILLK